MESLGRLRALHSNSLWDSLQDLLQAERLFHLERLSEADTDDEARDHRLIARYLKHFLQVVPEEVESMYQTKKHGVENTDPSEDLSTGGTPYMEDDGTEDESEV